MQQKDRNFQNFKLVVPLKFSSVEKKRRGVIVVMTIYFSDNKYKKSSTFSISTLSLLYLFSSRIFSSLMKIQNYSDFEN